MTVLRILLTCIMLTILPMAVGTLFLPLKEEKGARPLFAWIAGQMTLWAGFQAICVPAILRKLKAAQVMKAYFVFCVLLLLTAGVTALLRKGKRPAKMKWRGLTREKGGRIPLLLWGIFAVLCAIQVFCVFFLAYEEGDDAFYVAITTFSRELGTLYDKIPYTGEGTVLDARHALAPFPVWVAVPAVLSGLSGAATAHVVMPLFILAMAYGIYYLLGEKLLKSDGADHGWKMPLFMCFVSLLVTYGGYSVYSAENFLIVRAGQGKAVLANVVIPFSLYLLVLLLERLERKEKVRGLLWLLLFVVMTAGCLCSTLGSFLLCIPLGIATFCGMISYGRWKIVAGMIFAMLMPVLMAAAYVLLR